MARLVSWPVGLSANAREPLSGPRAVSGGSTQSIGNFTQTFASPFALWRIRFSFPPMRGQKARRYRGWITSLHGGANATRVPFCDWDGLSKAQRGVTGELTQGWLATTTEPEWILGDGVWDDEGYWLNSISWSATSYTPPSSSNTELWSNGQPWQGYAPLVAVAATAAVDDDTVSLANTAWGHTLDYGDQLGFAPLHFGVYMVTEVIKPGTYRIWPPLRRDLTTTDFATLRPTMAMRLESEDGASANRSAAFIENASVTLVEALDADVRTYWVD